MFKRRYSFSFFLLGLLVLFIGIGAIAKAQNEDARQEETAQPPAEPALEPEPAEKAVEPPKPARPNQVLQLEVRGNQIVSTNTILSKIRSQKGEPLIQETVNDDIKRLYSTGFFQDIKIGVEEIPNGYKLIIDVIEKPIVRRIEFSGFSLFKEDKLRKEMKIIEGQILDRKAVKQGVEAIRKLYANKGFRFVQIDSKIDVDSKTKEAVVTVAVEEGKKYKIKKLEFEGVKAFKPKKIKRLMKTKPKGFLRSGVFKEEEFQKDLEKIGLFYQQEGYLDIKIDPSFEYDREKNWIFIKILLDEGLHYVTGEIKISGNKLFPESEIWQELEMLPGLTYSQYYLSKDIEKIINYYHRRGYMDARVIPDVKLNRETGKVDVIYQIQEGDLYFVEKVIIRGNTKTRDIVIRRELRIRPGDRFDGDKIDKSKQRLENLDYFEEVTYDTEPGSDANRKDLVFRVKEKRTGELSFGGGISSIDKYVGFAEISQKNFDLLNWPRFTGGGQSLSVRGRIGSISQNYDVTFVEPYLFNKPISYSVSAYNTRQDDEHLDYNETRLGISNIFTRQFRDKYRLGTGYVLERVKLSDISEDAPTSVTDFAGVNWLSRWKAIIASYDTRDNIFNPTKGTLITFNGELVGTFLGGDQDFYTLQTSFTRYWTFFKKHTIEFKTRLGASQGIGQDKVPVFDRFYAGGLGTVRGYNYRRVGPIEGGNPVGGQTLAVVNLEYTRPIYLDSFRGAIFVDAGQVNSRAYRIGFGDFGVSIGPGLKIKTPLGPMAFYYGFPIANRDTENKNGRFEFSLSRGF